MNPILLANCVGRRNIACIIFSDIVDETRIYERQRFIVEQKGKAIVIKDRVA